MRVIPVVALLCLVAIGGCAADNVPSFYVRGVAAGLGVPGAGGAAEMAYEVRKDRQDLIEEILSVAEREATEQLGGPEWGPKYNAVALLGDLRAEEAVVPLLGQLGYEVVLTFGGLSTQGYGPTHPAAEALAKIGKPASRGALRRLPETAEPDRMRALVWVIAQVEGPDLAKYPHLAAEGALSPGPARERQPHAGAGAGG